MTGAAPTLRARLLWSHISVVAVGVIVLVLAGRRLGDAFVDDHLQAMSPLMHGSVEPIAVAQFDDGVRSAFARALWWAAGISAATAVAAATIAGRRFLAPIDEVRSVTREIAAGSYERRVGPPRERELAALAEDVNALAASLAGSEKRRSRLVGEVAHELRTPVATLKGYLEGLLDGVFTADAEILGAAIAEATRLERLAADLSTLSRAEEHRIDVHPVPIDVAETITAVETHLAGQFQDNNVALAVGDLPALAADADADRVAQILTNVLGNALAYTPAGGQVTVAAQNNADEIVVSITDTGRGLTSDELTLVFERFYRADRGAPGGSGIGLTIARNLARRHGGDLTASSDGPGRGATFTLTLPRTGRSHRSAPIPPGGKDVGP